MIITTATVVMVAALSKHKPLCKAVFLMAVAAATN